MLQLPSVHKFKNNYTKHLPDINELSDQNLLLLLLILLLKESEHLTFFEKNFIKKNRSIFGKTNEKNLKFIDSNPEVVKHFNFDQSIAELAVQVTDEYKIQLLLVLFDFSISSGILLDKNVVIIKQISDELKLSQETFLKVLNKYKFYNRNYRQKAFSNLSLDAKKQSLTNALKILGLPPTQDVLLIKKTYRKLAIQFHPDKNQFKTQKEIDIAMQNFKAINEAYEIIKDLLQF